MRKLLTSMLTLTLVFGSVMATPVMAEDNSGEVTQTKTIYVSYIDENGTPIEGAVIEQVVVPADAGNFSASLLKNVPAGYELAVSGDIACATDTINVTVRKAEKTIYVSYILEDGTPLPNAIEQVKVPADAGNFPASLLKNVPAGYELTVSGDIACATDTINVTVRKAEKTIYVSYILEDGTPLPNAIEQVKVPADAGNFPASLLKNVPAGYELTVSGDIACASDTINVTVRKAEKTIYVSYILEDGTPLPNAIEQVKVPADAGNFPASLLKNVPAGYELTVSGDIACPNDTINVTVRKAEKTVYVSYIDSETKMPLKDAIETIKIGASDTTFHSSLLKAIPAGYKLAYGVGDIYVGEGDSVNVEVTELAEDEKTVYVSYIDEETKMPLENAIEIIVIGAKDTTFNASILKAIPAGYELAQVGDVYVGTGDTVNVEVRKVAETKTIYVSYINEADKTPFENGIEEITVKADATFFNTSILKEVPVGFELVLTGDIYFGENDTVNVEVRKVAETKTVYVSYINEADKTPFENGIEKITVKADATYFNTSILKEVPAGFELVLTGDIYLGDNDTVNVEVRKVTTPSKPQEDSKPNTGASSNNKDDKKHVAAVANPLPGSNYTYVVPNTATK